MTDEVVKEGDIVKKGDVLMVLDSTDIDLSIEKTVAQIAQLEAQIQSKNGTIRIGYSQTNTNETESCRAIDQQRAAIALAEAFLENDRADYNRKADLVAEGAISKSEMDNATKALQVSEANVRQQQEGLAKLLGGTVDTGDSNTLALPAIDDQRQTLANDVEALMQQSSSKWP